MNINLIIIIVLITLLIKSIILFVLLLIFALRIRQEAIGKGYAEYHKKTGKWYWKNVDKNNT